MELLKYDKRTETSTIALTDVELVDLSSLVLGVLATFGHQDPTILGVSEDRLQTIRSELSRLLEARLASQEVTR